VLRVEGPPCSISQAGYISTTHWSLLDSTLGTTVHFNRSNGTAYTRPLSVCYKYTVKKYLKKELYIFSLAS
jgi:hypothetical protein